MSDQNCNLGITNTGQACTEAFGVCDFLVAQQTYDSVGNLNGIDTGSGPFDAAFFAALINHVDPSIRWYPLPKMKNIANMRNDPEFKSWDDNSKSFIQQGVRSFMGIAIGTTGAAPQMTGKLDSLRGAGVSFYMVDKFGNLIGKVDPNNDTLFCGVEAEADTIYSVLGMTVDKDVQQIKFGFDFLQTEMDKELKMIKGSELAASISNLRGLIDVTDNWSAPSITSFQVKLYTDGGTPLTPVLVKGLVAADFVSSVGGSTAKVRDKTASANVSITSVESPAGTYTITGTFPTGHTLILKPVKAGFDFTAVEANVILIP